MAGSWGQRNSSVRGRGGSREQIFSLPSVGKVMKKVLPPNMRISKEVKETVEQCLTEFVALITSNAVKKCHYDQRFELDGDDIIWAMAQLGFRDYVHPLQIYLHRYRNPDEANENEPESEPETETETETSTSAVPVWLLPRFGDGEYQNGILRVGTAKEFQDLPALILCKFY